MDSSSRQKIKETATLNNTLYEMDLIVFCRTFLYKAAKYTFFSSVHGSFSKIYHMVGHEINLKKFKKIEIISSIFSDNNGLKIEINPN